MVLEFKTEFVSKIFTGTKIHTIRKDANKECRPGTIIHMNESDGKLGHNNCFRVETCVSVQEIEVDTSAERENNYYVKVDSRILTPPELRMLAWRDGFRTVMDFFNFFKEDGKPTRTLRLIHWTDFKY